jgi:hypothetical protein
MLVGAYPFEDPDDPKNFRKTITVSTPIPRFYGFRKNQKVILFSNKSGQ